MSRIVLKDKRGNPVEYTNVDKISVKDYEGNIVEYSEGSGGLTPIAVSDWITKPFAGDLYIPSDLVQLFEDTNNNLTIPVAEIRLNVTQDIFRAACYTKINSGIHGVTFYKKDDEHDISHTIKYQSSGGKVTDWTAYVDISQTFFSVKYYFYSLESIL